MVLSWLGLEQLTRDYKCHKEFSWELGHHYKCKRYEALASEPTPAIETTGVVIPVCRFSPIVLDHFILKQKLNTSYVYLV